MLATERVVDDYSVVAVIDPARRLESPLPQPARRQEIFTEITDVRYQLAVSRREQ